MCETVNEKVKGWFVVLQAQTEDQMVSPANCLCPVGKEVGEVVSENT